MHSLERALEYKNADYSLCGKVCAAGHKDGRNTGRAYAALAAHAASVITAGLQ